MIFNAIKNLKDSFNQEPLKFNIDENSIKDIINQYNDMKLSADAFTERINLTDASLKSYFKTVKSGKATFSGYQAYTNSAASATGLLGIKAKITAGAIKTLKVAMGMIGTMFLATVIDKIISGLDSLHKTSKEIEEAAENAKQKIDELTDSFNAQKSSLDEIKERYAELAQGVDLLTNKNLTLSTEDYEEFLTLNKQLASIFPQLTRGIDDNGNEILNLSGDVNTIIGSLDELIRREKMLTDKQILEEMPDAYEGFKQNYDKYNEEIDLLERKAKAIQTLKNLDYSVDNDVFKNDAILKWNLPLEIDEAELMDIEGQLTNALNEAGVDSDYITSSFKDANTDGYVLTLTMPKVELETNDIKSILGNYVSIVNDELQIARYELEDKTSEFSKYMSTWLSDQSKYKGQTQEVKDALEEMMFSGDWLDEAFKDPDVDPNNWDSLSKWFTENYLEAIEKINDKEIKNKLNELFIVDDVQTKLDLANEIQEYFNKNGILISLDFVLNENDYTSTQGIKNSFDQSLNDISGGSADEKAILDNYIKKQGISSEAQMNYWLKVTQGIQGAYKAINEYESSLNKVEEIDFFTDDNLEAINNYKSKINDLGVYLEKINTEHKLSAEDLSDLNLTYDISADTLEEYEQAIIKEMNELSNNSEVMNVLAEAIETCDDAIMKSRLEDLYEALQNINVEAQKAATSFENLSEAVSTLDSSASLLRDLKEEIDKTGHIDFSNSDDILSDFPEMTEEVALFNAGLMDSEELFEKLEQAYQNNVDEYADTIKSELQYNEEFYDHITDNLEDWVLNMAEAYGINLTDYKTLNEEKLALDKEYARRKAVLDEALLKNEAMNDVLQSPESKDFTADDFREALGTHEAYLTAQSDLENIQAIIDAIDTSFTTNVSWETFGKDDDSGSGDKDNMTEIDWADQSLKVLQDEVDKFQTALDNTKGLDNQINAIDDLNGALKKLKGGYQSAYDEYEQRYNDTVSGLGEDIRKKIESGEEFDLSQYDSDTAKDIQNSIDYFNKMAEAEAKVNELSNQIDFNDNIEKSKLLQQSYELQLKTINTKLEDQTLSVDEKNDLLDEQLRLQIAINDLLREQAKYEGDYETVSKLDAEDKNRKLQKRLNKLQGKRDRNQVYIDTYNEKLEDTTLTSEDINKLNNGLQSVTNRDFKYRFKEMIEIAGIDTWDDYIASLKEKYSEQDMGDKKFIKKHLGEISHYFSHTGMEELYYEYLSSERGFEETDYETKKNERNYHQNDIANNIQDIQDEIELQGGRGTEEQYKDLESLYKSSKDYWTQQKQDAEAMRDSFVPFTAEWDKWNNEVQECDDNIHECDSSIKDCNISILKLPLNEVEDSLRDIESKLRDINRNLEDQTELISAAEGILDNEIYTNEILKEAVEDKIKKLEKENDLRQANLNIQKAEYELEKARNQRSSKIFKEGQGWVYESDADSINEAQYNYDNAVYEHKLALLNDQVEVYDEEIKRLNRIKDRWSRINTEAENLVLINKALLYDKGFIGKVLEEDANFMVGISSVYSSLLSQKDSYEDQQEDYTTLQDIINDTVEMYDLEAIGYEEAKQRIKNAIVQYYPEIISKYENEEETLDRVAKKKLEDAGVTEETSEEIFETVKKSNKKILKNYNKLVEGLDGVFEQLNGMLETYSENTQTMVDSISASIESLRNQLAGVQSGVDDATGSSDSSESSGSKNNNKNNNKKNNKNNNKNDNKKKKKAGKSHSGLELGYIGESSKSKDKDAFEYIALSELSNNEIVRVLQKGEAVLTDAQVSQVMNNFRNLAQVRIPNVTPYNSKTSQSVNFNGDIIVQGVQDTNSFAMAIRNQLPNAMLQELYK